MNVKQRTVGIVVGRSFNSVNPQTKSIKSIYHNNKPYVSMLCGLTYSYIYIGIYYYYLT